MSGKHNGKKRWLLALPAAALLALLLANLWMISRAKPYLQAAEAAEAGPLILVLGAGLEPDGSPSPMLAERVRCGAALWQAGKGARLLMSGAARPGHDEIAAMSLAAQADGVPAAAIQGDGEGLNTYASMWNLAQAEPGAQVLIVTQRYHLYRAVYIARALGLDARGVPCDTRAYGGQLYRDLRELLARTKDVLLCLPARLGAPYAP